MPQRLFYFRPGEEHRMLARCQFGINEQGKCGATLTYPIEGYPWRRNIQKSFEFDLGPEERAALFAEVRRLRAEHPGECLANEDLWSDASEKANGVTRDRKSGTLCHTIGIRGDQGEWKEYFSMRENSRALVDSTLYKTISKLIQPYEKLT